MNESNEKQVEMNQEAGVFEKDDQPSNDRSVFIPRANIYETENELQIVLDIPGALEGEIDLQLEKNILSIHAKVEPNHESGYSQYCPEYRVGDYQRRFKLSNEIDQEHIQADYRHGVLHLALPKAEAAKAKKIKVLAA